MSPTGKLFRFVRECVRAVWLPSGIGSQRWPSVFSLFPLWRAELSPFPFGGDDLPPFPPPHPPNRLPTLVELTYRHSHGLHPETVFVICVSHAFLDSPLGPSGNPKSSPKGPQKTNSIFANSRSTAKLSFLVGCLWINAVTEIRGLPYDVTYDRI